MYGEAQQCHLDMQPQESVALTDTPWIKSSLKKGRIQQVNAKKMQRLCSYFILFFSFSLGIAAGDRGRAQLRSFSQVIGPLASRTDPSLSSRIHIRQKQLSHIYGQEQRQCRGHGDLTVTPQILSARLWVWPVEHNSWSPLSLWQITFIFQFSLIHLLGEYFCFFGSSLTVSTSLCTGDVTLWK